LKPSQPKRPAAQQPQSARLRNPKNYNQILGKGSELRGKGNVHREPVNEYFSVEWCIVKKDLYG